MSNGPTGTKSCKSSQADKCKAHQTYLLLQLVEILQPLAIAACSHTAKSSGVSGCVLPDDSSGCLHFGCQCLHAQAD